MTAPMLIFLTLAAISVVGAVRVVTARLITHAALFLVLVFAAIAGIFILLHADFLAAAQVLIYAGAITTMIIFAIMLSDIRDVREVPDERPGLLRRIWRAFTSQLGLLPVLIGALFTLGMFWVYSKGTWLISSQPPVESSVREIGYSLFTADGYAIPFEVASFILLVAMVGAIVLTAKEEQA